MSEPTDAKDAALSAAFDAGLAAAHAEDRRSPDQDTAIEQAFVAGVLPEEDRRAPEHVDVFEWLRRGDGTEVLYTNGQVEHDGATIEVQRKIREVTR